MPAGESHWPYNGVMIDPKVQPTHGEKLEVLNGFNVAWDYLFHVPSVDHSRWSNEDWIVYIGDNWFRKP